MKTLLFSLLICVLVVPVMVASFLIVTAISALIPDLYFASMSLALTFAILTMVWGAFWRELLSRISFRFFQRNRQSINSLQEKKYEHSIKARCVRGIVSALVVVCFIALTASRAQAGPSGGRTVKYSQQDIVAVHAKIRFSTLIVLPQNEDILDFATGDKEFWIINGAHNLCYIHPAQTGIRSYLHLITSAGRVYSFLLTEVSNDPSLEPDLKLFVEPADESSISGGSPGLQNFVRADEMEAYKK